MSHSRKPIIAGVLSFVVPGLGLLYVGYKKRALLNFVVVNITLLVFTVFVADPTLIEHVHWLFLGLAALSAGYAHGVASSSNRDSDASHDIATTQQSTSSR